MEVQAVIDRNIPAKVAAITDLAELRAFREALRAENPTDHADPVVFDLIRERMGKLMGAERDRK